MCNQVRKGYENYEADLEKSFAFLFNHRTKEVERRSDGSFHTLTSILLDASIRSVRIYYEFIEQQLIVTVGIGNDYRTTMELNKELGLFEIEKLKPSGDDYKSVLEKNAQVVKEAMKRPI